MLPGSYQLLSSLLPRFDRPSRRCVARNLPPFASQNRSFVASLSWRSFILFVRLQWAYFPCWETSSIYYSLIYLYIIEVSSEKTSTTVFKPLITIFAPTSRWGLPFGTLEHQPHQPHHPLSKLLDNSQISYSRDIRYMELNTIQCSEHESL